MGILFTTVFMIVLIVMMLLNTGLTIKDVIKKKGNKEFKRLALQRVFLTIRLGVVVIIVYILNTTFILNYNNTSVRKLENMIITMYTTDYDQLDTKLEPYKKYLTGDALDTINIKDSPSEIIDRYKKYSNSNNRLVLHNTVSNQKGIIMHYSIITDSKEPVNMMTVFERSAASKYKTMDDYILTPIRDTSEININYSPTETKKEENSQKKVKEQKQSTETKKDLKEDK